MLSANDQAIRPPRALLDNEVLDLGGKRVRYLATPHVPPCGMQDCFMKKPRERFYAGISSSSAFILWNFFLRHSV